MSSDAPLAPTTVGPPGGAGLATCDVPGLSVSAQSSSTLVEGYLVQTFVVENTAASACEMISYPGVYPFGLQSQGSVQVEADLAGLSQVPFASDGSNSLGNPASVQVLRPGQGAVFFLGVEPSPARAACTRADGFSFKSPRGNGYLNVDYRFTLCGSQYHVSTLQPEGTVPT